MTESIRMYVFEVETKKVVVTIEVGVVNGDRGDAAAGCEHAAGTISDRKYREPIYGWTFRADDLVGAGSAPIISAPALSVSKPAEMTQADVENHLRDVMANEKARLRQKGLEVN